MLGAKVCLMGRESWHTIKELFSLPQGQSSGMFQVALFPGTQKTGEECLVSTVYTCMNSSIIFSIYFTELRKLNTHTQHGVKYATAMWSYTIHNRGYPSL